MRFDCIAGALPAITHEVLKMRDQKGGDGWVDYNVRAEGFTTSCLLLVERRVL